MVKSAEDPVGPGTMPFEQTETADERAEKYSVGLASEHATLTQ